jgi:iron(II)-dependent oxidoreductase
MGSANWPEQALDARRRTLELAADLGEDELLRAPSEPSARAELNPLGWELGHVAWFQEFWLLRDGGRRPSLLEGSDAIYDSTAIPRRRRWSLALPGRALTLEYLGEVLGRVLDAACDPYFLALTTLHEDQHDEAISYTRRALGLSPGPGLEPGLALDLDLDLGASSGRNSERSPPGPDVLIPGGTYRLGAPERTGRFVFDNEKWSHPIQVEPFAIGRTCVTRSEYLRFSDDRGYARRELWSEQGWRWRTAVGVTAPRPALAAEPRAPIEQVSWFEADAYCRWAGRRLPTELEWEVAAAAEPGGDGALSAEKRSYPWGAAPPAPDRANLDFAAGCALDVAALPRGDSAFGCRQMLGNVWEWTASDFGPYPGFSPDPYREYSAPWFVGHKVLRGGSWATRSRLIHTGFRNFHRPGRRDLWAGFRTCALRD